MTFVSASGCYLYDASGQRWLDAGFSNALVGHAHPAVTDAVARELRNGGLNRSLQDALQERLLALLPAGFTECYLTNSLTEANELALRLARAHGAGKDVIVLDGAEHGMSTSLVNMGPERRKFWVQVASRLHASDVAEKAGDIRASGRGLCGFFAEGLFPEGYLRQAYASIRAAGGLNIAVEAQTGLGRVGPAMWEFVRQQADPDVVVIGESLANGLPLAAVVTRKELATPFVIDAPASTVAIAAAHAVLDVLTPPTDPLCAEFVLDTAVLTEHHITAGERGNATLFRPPLCWSAQEAELWSAALRASGR